MDHQPRGLNEGFRDHSNNVEYWSKGLKNKGRRSQSGHTNHQSRGLDRGLRVYSGQRDHQSRRLDENPGDQNGQVDCRSTRPDKGSKCYSGLLTHRSIRPDNSSGEHFGPQDQQNNIKSSPKFSSHRGLNWAISTDSQTSDQECDMVTGANHTPHTIPEFLTGQPMQSQEHLQHPEETHSESSQDPIQQVPGIVLSNTTTDPINRLADILVGINNRPSTQTLTVRPALSARLQWRLMGIQRNSSSSKIFSTQWKKAA